MGKATAQTIWGVHAGTTGDADTLFLQSGVIALDGWKAMGIYPRFRRIVMRSKRRAQKHTPTKPDPQPSEPSLDSLSVFCTTCGKVIW